MIDHLRTMAIFRTVVEAGSFRSAAKMLGLSPSVVSHHVSQLEQHLQTALLYRSTRKISLTEDGAELFAASQKMIEAANAGLEAIQRRSDQPSGRLRVAAAGAVFESPPYIDHLIAFSKRYTQVDLTISFSDQKIELIGSTFDVALRIGFLEDSQYKARKLCELERVIIASPDYLAGRAMPKTLEDLASWDWIKLSQFPVARQMASRSGEVPAFDPKVSIEVDSVAALHQMVARGLGLAAVPRFLVKDQLQTGELIALTPNWDLMAPGVFAVWPNNVSADSLTLRFVHFLADRLSGT
ncbi:MAG: LysR family transcriptional regulator [Alphaproteobacteria bacterium]|nr:LysR family transcriptional regulator [Alphaproteobacteria bacterium]